MVDETHEGEEILQATVELLQVFPEAELKVVMEAVTRAASLSGERAYDTLVEQAVDIYLESEQGASKEESDSSPVDYVMTSLQNLQPKSSLEHPAERSESTISTNKTKINSDLQANIASTMNPSLKPSLSNTPTGSGEIWMEVGTSRTISETTASTTGKRAHAKTGLESPNFVPSKKANVESISSEMDNDDEQYVLVPSNSVPSPRKEVQTGLYPKNDPGGTSPYDDNPTVQELLQLLSTEIANQESKQNDIAMPDISVGQNMTGNCFGSGHLQSITNYILGKMKQFSSAQSSNAVMNSMSKLFLTTESDSLQSDKAENLGHSPTNRPSSSPAAGGRGADRGPIACSSATSKREDGATGYTNYRVTNSVDTDEDITRSDTRLMLDTTDDFEADGSAFFHDFDLMTCSACSSVSVLHKCVSCYAGHFLCKHCVAVEVQSVILSKQKIGLLCPAKSCTELLSLTSLEQVVDEFLLELLRKNLEHKERKFSLKAIKTMEGLVSCPGCSYTGLMDNEEYEFVCGNTNCTVRCCRYCKSNWTNKDDHLGCYLLSSVGTECFNDITILPLNWQKTDTSHNAFQVKIETSSLEGLGWNEYFQQTNPTKRIVALWRIQNRRLWERYVVKRKHMAEELGLGNIQEKALFHGTRYENINLIANEGFDFRVQTVNGSKWGKGIYFGKSAAYSQTFACDRNYMFIARVLCGQSTYGHEYLTRPPHNSSGRMFDSCVDNIESMYAVFDNTQCYPEILLQFN